MKHFSILIAGASAFLTVIYSCKEKDKENESLYCNNSFDPQTWDSCNYINYKSNDFLIRDLSYYDLPYISNDTLVKREEIYDADSVPLHNYKGRLNYHPVFIAQYALNMLDVYVTTKDAAYLDQLDKIVDKLIGISMEKDSALFFPYVFEFPLHDCIEETMLTPWYSGMAQGQILSLVSRLYELTNDIKYLNIGNKIFNSFTKLKGDNNYPWVTCVDKNGNLWIEEYPRDLPCFTLNGMIFAIYGVYDYYRITKNDYAEEIMKAAITTIKDNIHKYRNEADISWYCLKHKNYHAQNAKYHKIHCEQLKMLYKITGDKYFDDMALTFEEDVQKLNSKVKSPTDQ